MTPQTRQFQLVWANDQWTYDFWRERIQELVEIYQADFDRIMDQLAVSMEAWNDNEVSAFVDDMGEPYRWLFLTELEQVDWEEVAEIFTDTVQRECEDWLAELEAL